MESMYSKKGNVAVEAEMNGLAKKGLGMVTIAE